MSEKKKDVCKVNAIYDISSCWYLDRDIKEAHNFHIGADTLSVQWNEGDEYQEIEPLFLMSEHCDYKRPDQIYADGNLIYNLSDYDVVDENVLRAIENGTKNSIDQFMVNAIYDISSCWNLDRDIKEAHNFFMKWDELSVQWNEGDEYEKIEPVFLISEDFDFEYPDKVLANGELVYEVVEENNLREEDVTSKEGTEQRTVNTTSDNSSCGFLDRDIKETNPVFCELLSKASAPPISQNRKDNI